MSGGRPRPEAIADGAGLVLRHDDVTSVLIGASQAAQIDDAVGMLENRHFSAEELNLIEEILTSSK